MKEKMIQYKWPLVIIAIVLLNIGWIIYDNNQMEKGILIEEAPNRSIMTSQTEEKEIPLATELPSEEQIISTQAISPNEQPQSEVLEVALQVPVYICGAVLNPGVYYVDQDAIVNDVIQCAGGLTREADETVINLASPIQPNEKIIIPKQGQEIDKTEDSYENRERIETLPTSESNLQTSKTDSSTHNTNTINSNGLVNINTATQNELMSLNGIGEVKAQAIITYRNEQGGFKSIEEIMQISGIGEKTFEKIKPFITT